MIIILLVFTFLIVQVLPARILVVVPFPGKSHHIFTTAIVKALAERGHEIEEYSPYAPQTPISNHNHTEIHTRWEQEQGAWTYEKFMKIPPRHDWTIGCKMGNIWNMNYKICEDTFKNENITNLLKSNVQFDLVMTESTFGEECLLAFGHRFSAPTITIEGLFPWSIVNSDAGNALSIASVPDVTSATFTNNLFSFKERLLNFISVSLTLFGYYYFHIPTHDKIIKKNFDWPDTPPVAAMVSNVSLYLTNSHPAVVNYVHPYTPNIIPIGGIHIPHQVTQLPKYLCNFMDDAKEGVIFFSLGTVVPMHVMPRHILQIFINVFKKLPQKVLWKINIDSLPELPKNVKIVHWVPQLAVLLHPNCLLFITHGGLFSHQEAIYAGVPTIGIPFFVDQPYNVQFSEHQGNGVKLDFTTLNEASLQQSIATVLKNPKYKENADRLSHIYRDRTMSASDLAVFWVEYVIRHRGARHLQPASAHMPLYQRALLDIAAVIIVSLILFVSTSYILLRTLFTALCSKVSHSRESKLKKIN